MLFHEIHEILVVTACYFAAASFQNIDVAHSNRFEHVHFANSFRGKRKIYFKNGLHLNFERNMTQQFPVRCLRKRHQR